MVGWAEEKATRPSRENAPVYFLRVHNPKDGTRSYFSVPLSEAGVDIFKNSLGSLLGYTNDGNSRLTATMSDDEETLRVTMVVTIDGQSITLSTREYHIAWIDDLKHVVVWSNFVSDNWNKYYYYTEYTQDAAQKFLPIFRFKGEFMRDGNGAFLTPLYQPKPNETVPTQRLITYPAGQGEQLPHYDIWSSTKPVGGLLCTTAVSGKDERAGYLLVRHDIVKDFTAIDTAQTAVLGFDFGSNNTCVYYNPGDRGAKAVEFENNRAVLVGLENDDMRASASQDELLFFTNYPSPNGQLKSWLHEHDTRYNSYNEAMEVAGGVPVNRPNVMVKEMTEYEILTQVGKLHYNMKWLNDDSGLKKKRAFLKSIYLQTCAFLYKQRIRPVEIRWSHPGSMMECDVNDYEKIFDELTKLTPLTTARRPTLGDSLPTEAEAVTSYALQQDFGLRSTNMFLGIDVGGSTSDILLIAKDEKNDAALYRESSVRLAAGVFFDAVINSDTFRTALINFHEGHSTQVYVANINEVKDNPAKAPYYLNSIFDQLREPSDYDAFYDSIDSDAKFVFTIPAYVSGLLLFYSGMLVGKAIKEHSLTHLQSVEILSFGKGGRIFHWLRSSAGARATNQYYADCVNAGVKCIVDAELEVKYRDEIEEDNKAEVARGLCDPRDVVKKQLRADTDICGERGVNYLIEGGGKKELGVDDELTGDYFADRMAHFDFTCSELFEQFMDIFIAFVSQKTRMYPKAESDLRDDLRDLPSRIAAKISNNDSEYRKAVADAKDGSSFHYHQPIIIAEGICFLDTLIRKAFNQ